MGAMTVAITGANGFVGRACVAEARRRGLSVVAIHRRDPCIEWQRDPAILPLRADLSQKAATARLIDTLTSCDALIHAAAHVGDDDAALQRDTVLATGLLTEAVPKAQVRLVLVSSLAVYDTDALSPGATLTEASPVLPTAGPARDAYAGAKRQQEALVQQADLEDCWILRPGAIWGAGRTWHDLQGFWLSSVFVTIGSDGELPLAHVDHVAAAALSAAIKPADGTQIVNVFDDDRPTRSRFLQAHRRIHGWPRHNFTIPFNAWLALSRLLRPIAGNLPGLLREPILRARVMPLRYPNMLMRSTFGGEDMDTFEGMMTRTRGTA